MKYLECLRTVFGGGSATPPEDAAATLARGAKRLRAVIETETRAGQTLAASWAGAFAVAGPMRAIASRYRSKFASALEEHARLMCQRA